MSMQAPSPQQRQFAGQVAWERGKKINWASITTSSKLSGLIDTLKRDFAPLAAEEAQLDAYRRTLASCVERIGDFDPAPYSELPSDRATANQAIFQMRKELARVEYRSASNGDLSDLVSDIGETPGEIASAVEADAAAGVSDDSDVPF